jgi:D-alanine-D-alanine ligase
LPGERIRVAVLFGGRSGEHDVSCASARSILTHLDRTRFSAVPVRIGRTGRWTVGGCDPADVTEGAVTAAALDTLLPHDASGSPAESVLRGLDALRSADVIFPALHGPFGEDGTLQSCLAGTGVPFVGCGALASALGMDKVRTKQLLGAAGLAVADGIVIRPGTVVVPARVVERLGLPLFVKPCRNGSSLGVSRVDDAADLRPAVELARRSDPVVLVESAVPGREIDIGVLELPDGTAAISPPLEIRVADGGVFDYEAKYDDPRTTFEVPAAVEAATVAELRAHAVTAFTTLGCRGLLRVDFFLRPDGRLVLNEVNTLPGFTAASQYPRMWQAAGLTYPDLLEVLLTTALAGGPERGAPRQPITSEALR